MYRVLLYLIVVGFVVTQGTVATGSRRGNLTVLSQVPEFSYAGYHRSQRPLPEIDTQFTVLRVEDYGGIPNDGQSDRAAVIAALQAANRMQGPVVIRFPAGRFIIRADEDFLAPAININRSHTVLQGAGSNPGGTELYLAAPSKAYAFFICPSGPEPHWRGNKVADIRTFGPVGTFTVEVDSASKLRAGMFVHMVSFLPEGVNNPSVRAYFAPHDPMPKCIENYTGKPWRASLLEMHQIDRIEGRNIVFSEPIHHEGHEISLTNGYLAVFTGPAEDPVSEVGLTDLAFTTGYEESYYHYLSLASDGYYVLKYESVVNSWARNLRFRGYTYAMQIKRSMNNTFRDILLEGNAGHQAISTLFGYGNLVSHVREFTDTHHGLGATDSATNTVYHRCVQFGSLEAHCGYPRATLFDRNDGMFTVIRPGGAQYTPHHGKRLTFWNWNNTQGLSVVGAVLPLNENVDFWPEGSRYGYFMPPLIVGLHGDPVDIDDEQTDVALLVSRGQKATPDSLFENQLICRTGSLPDDMALAANRFETIRRFSRAEFAAPLDNAVATLGHALSCNATFPESMDPNTIHEVTLVGSRTPWVIDAQPLAILDGDTSVWQPSDVGVWKLWLRVEDASGAVTTSRPVHVFVQVSPDGTKDTVMHHIPAVWFQSDRVLDPTKTARDDALKAYEKSGNLASYYSTLRTAQQQKIAPLVEAETGVRALTDGYVNSTFRISDSTGRKPKPSAVVLDLGQSRASYVLRLQYSQHLNSDAYYSLEIQASDNPNALYSFTNDDRVWTAGVRRVGSTHTEQHLPAGEKDIMVYFPETQARYFRVVFQGMSPNTLAEISIGGPTGQ